MIKKIMILVFSVFILTTTFFLSVYADSFPGINGKIAFISSRDGDYGTYTIDPNTLQVIGD